MRRKAYFLFGLLILALFLPGQAMAAGTPAGTVITNQAYADYQDANGNALPRVFSNEVTTEVSQVGGVSLDPATAVKTAKQGTSAGYGVTVTNSGNGTDTIDLAVDISACPGWTATIYWDENGNGVRDTGEDTVVSDTGSLAADGIYHVVIVVDVPGGTANDTQCDAVLTATSQFDGGVTATGTYTTRVEDAVLEVTKSADPATGVKPGDTITYALEGHNTGSATAESVVVTDPIPANTTYVTGSIRIGPVGGTYATANPQTDAKDGDMADYNVTTPGAVTIAWGDSAPEPDPTGSGVIYFQVQVNASVPSGTAVSNTADVDYAIAGNPQPTYSSTTAQFTIQTLPALLLDPDNAKSGNPGDQMVYPFTVTNQGNATDTVDITYTSSSGWTWAIWEDLDGNGIPGTDGDAKLSDTDGDGIIDTGALTQGQSRSLLAVVTIPAGTSDGTVDTTVITGTSSQDTGVKDTVTLTTTVTAPSLSIVKAVSPTGAQPPGTELTYTVTVTNNGTGNATSVVITDLIPDFTTYKAGSMRTGASTGTLTSRTDASDGDGAAYNSGINAVVVGNSGSLSIGPGGQWIVEFKVTID